MDYETILAEYRREVDEKNQRFTVFMLTHNRERYVIPALRSLLRQTYDNFQILVLDNLSQDHTAEKIAELKSDRIRYLYRESMPPKNSNYRFAFDACVTEYLAVVHDDDLYREDYVEKMLTLLSQNPDLAAVSVSAEFIDENDMPLDESARTWSGGIVRYDGNHSYLKNWVRNKDFVNVMFPAAVYKTSVYKGHMDDFLNPATGPAGDQYVWFQTERLGHAVVVLDAPLFYYRLHSGQNSFSNMHIMDVQLLNFLLTIDDYRQALEEIRPHTQWKIFRAMWGAFMLRAEGRISGERARMIFQYTCSMDFMKGSLRGRALLFAARMGYRFPRISHAVFRAARACYRMAKRLSGRESRRGENERREQE